MRERKSDSGAARVPAQSVKLTPQIEEGPYYKADSPERTKLIEPGIPGERLRLSGYVYDINLDPVENAWLDFWQADGRGEYDNQGYKLRGHQHTDRSGRYTVETVMPGGYLRRTPHIHVKVRAADGRPVLTTQLFIPGVKTNQTDFLYREDLLINIKDTPEGKVGSFNFII